MLHFWHVCAVSCEWRDARRAHVKLNVRVAVFGDARAHSVALVDSVSEAIQTIEESRTGATWAYEMPTT